MKYLKQFNGSIFENYRDNFVSNSFYKVLIDDEFWPMKEKIEKENAVDISQEAVDIVKKYVISSAETRDDGNENLIIYTNDIHVEEIEDEWFIVHAFPSPDKYYLCDQTEGLDRLFIDLKTKAENNYSMI